MSVMHNLALAFAETVRLHGERPAIYPEEVAATTYAELNAISNQLARYFRKLGLERGDVLGLFHDKSAIGYAAMLACLKLGAIYVNLDEANPLARLARILETAKPKWLVSSSAAFPDFPHETGLLPGMALAGASADAWRAELDSDLLDLDTIAGTDPAYLMYTSGSTGTPKGAAIPHGAVLRFIEWIRSRFSIVPQDVFTGLNPAYFDNSVFDFYGSLFNGAALVPITRKTAQNPHQALACIERAGCTMWFSVPSMLVYAHTLKALQDDSLPSLKHLVFGGEGFPKSVLAQLFEKYGARMRLVNVYGPTECTCICSAHDVVVADFESSSGLAPLGKLNPDFIGLVLDDAGNEAGVGEAGELWLGGPNVGLGYYNDVERTERAFLQNPTHARYRDIFYRTGDLVRQNASGLLEFVGRKDNQIKHLGYRIELEEIENALCRLPEIAQAGAIYRRTHAEFGQIEAYVVAEAGCDEAAIRANLRGLLPDYMIPRRVFVKSALPKNANGKVDRKALAVLSE